VVGPIIDTVHEWLVKDDWNFERDPERSLIKTGVKAKNASYRLFFDAKEEEQQLIIYIVCPNSIPMDKLLEGAEFVTRANYGLRIGNFEMDMSDGEVRYKVSVDVEGGKLGPTMVENMVDIGVGTIDKYFPGLMTMLYSGKSPEDAIGEVEE